MKLKKIEKVQNFNINGNPIPLKSMAVLNNENAFETSRLENLRLKAELEELKKDPQKVVASCPSSSSLSLYICD